MKICLNHRHMTFDFCRNCKGYDLNCQEYLSDIEHITILDRTLVRTDKKQPSRENSPLVGEEKSDSYSKPFYFSSRRDLELLIPRPDFLERFYRNQR